MWTRIQPLCLLLVAFYHPLLTTTQEFAPKSKVGTWGVEFTVIFCAVKPEFRQRRELFSALDRALVAMDQTKIPLLPPRKNAVYQIQSESLGVVAYTFTIPISYNRLWGQKRGKELEAAAGYIRKLLSQGIPKFFSHGRTEEIEAGYASPNYPVRKYLI